MTSSDARASDDRASDACVKELGPARPIGSVLVANRGEIARRVFRTARELGLATVAVYSDADAGAPHAVEADAAVRLPGSAPADTYLRADLLIGAALRAGADAVHPGYGFLSENAAFARAVIDAGLLWIGPPPGAVESMGSKIEAKRLMAAAGVPVLAEADPGTLTEADLPVLVKASAGGGGRGMRVVRTLAELPGELAAARAEAESAFGDPTVFCEPYLATGHHVEVQLLADRHGTVWAVGERECSIQRRHQKVIEEAPSPLVERLPQMRGALFEAARRAARAVGYVGAGTVEFLADDTGRFFFLEMNTRLQVEHPVTECTTGLDLVRWQLRIAEGARLPAEPPARTGYAIEARLYAEDPAADWQPQSGRVHRIRLPGVAAEFANPAGDAGIRLDSGVTDGSEVGIHYDPMLAKAVGWGPGRAEAAGSLARALARAELHGPTTNRELLVRVLRHPAFLAGETDTAFFDRHGLDALARPLTDAAAVRLSALAAALAEAAGRRAEARVQRGLPSGWRNVPSQPQRTSYLAADGTTVEVAYRLGRSGWLAEGHDDGVALVEATAQRVLLDVDGVRRGFAVARYGRQVYVDSPLGPVALTSVDRFPDPVPRTAPGSLLAPMPGTVVRLGPGVAVGEPVTAGQPLLWLEAMKMQHRIDAPADGVLSELRVDVGRQVDAGAVLGVVLTD
jgi:propionyl-CoA carboxylase alpha chain